MDGNIEKDGKIVIGKHNPDINIYKQDYENWKHEAKNLWIPLEMKELMKNLINDWTHTNKKYIINVYFLL